MNESLKFAGATALGMAVGLAVGYKVAEKRLSTQFEERLQKETEEMRTFYSTVKKKFASPEEAVAELIPEPESDPEPEDPRVKRQKVQYNKIVREEEYAISDELEGAAAAEEVLAGESGVVIQRNIWESKPDHEKPYIIDQDEYMANDVDHDQASVTYYENGGVVVDERDDPIDNVDVVLGTEFKEKFGVGSSDENVVHIRNEPLRMDFEVVRSERSYEEDVLGETNPPEEPRDRLRREG